MRIGLSSTLAQRGRSGIGQYVVNLLAALLREAPHDEYVVYALEQDLPLFGFARDSVRLVTIGDRRRSPGHDLAWHHLTLPQLAREQALDVLHVPTHRRMLWQRPCALVTTVHDVGAFRIPRDSASRGSCPGAVFRALARRQDVLVTPTLAAAEELIRLTGMAANRVAPIHCGVDAQRFTPGSRDEAATLIARRHALHPPYFLSVARLDRGAHDHARLIAAFTAFKTASPSPWQLVLLGAEGGGADAIRRLALRSPYAPDIHCPGFVPAEDIPHWYRAAGALIYTPRRWGFGLPLLEAMACGCPVLTADDSVARELCLEAAMYVNQHDTVVLQQSLAALAGDAARRGRLAAAGLQRVRTFDWSTTASAMRETYNRAAHRLRRAVVVTPPVTTPAH